MDLTKSRVLDFFSGRRFWIGFVSIIVLTIIFSAFDLKASSCHVLLKNTPDLARAYCTPSFRFHTQWQKVDDQTLRFDGEILSDNLDEFNKLFTPNIKTVEVNSIKGDFRAAFQVGELLKKQHVTVVVKEYCASACANYWFLAADKKVLDGGVVGFHGNYNALARGLTDQQLKENLKAEFKSAAGTQGTQAQLEAAHQRFKKLLEQEKQFYQDLGIDQGFFDQSQQEDKGAGDGKKYIFLVPSSKIMQEHGVKNIQGEQSMAALKRLSVTGNLFYKE